MKPFLLRDKFRKSRDGFTILEAAIALTVIAIAIGAFVLGMSTLNQEASVSRNATGAAAVLQNEVDLILSHGPFNPQKTAENGTPQIPPQMTVGTHVTNNVAIYREPNTGIIVSGTLTTNITDISPTYFGITLYLYKAYITVTYVYRGRTYSASRSTLRASDI